MPSNWAQFSLGFSDARTIQDHSHCKLHTDWRRCSAGTFAGCLDTRPYRSRSPAAKTTSSRLAFVIEYPRPMQSRIHVYEVLLAIAQVPSYIPGGARSFWKLIGLLLPVVGFLIALWLIWVVLRWVAKKLGAASRRK